MQYSHPPSRIIYNTVALSAELSLQSSQYPCKYTTYILFRKLQITNKIRSADFRDSHHGQSLMKRPMTFTPLDIIANHCSIEGGKIEGAGGGNIHKAVI